MKKLSQEVRESDLYDNLYYNQYMTLGEVGFLLTHIARDLDKPAPTQHLGSGSFGHAWHTSHPRQVVKVTRDPWEIATFLALRAGLVPKHLRKMFCGCIHIHIIRRPVCWDQPGWHDYHGGKCLCSDPDCRMCDCDACAVIWKERLDTVVAPRESRIMIDNPAVDTPRELRHPECDLRLPNNGVRGRRVKTTLTFDGRLQPQTLEKLIPKNPNKRAFDADATVPHIAAN